MQQQIKKWGNGAALRLPVAIMKAAHLTVDTTVELRVVDGRIVIEPTRAKSYRLQDLVANITPGNRHDAIETGDAVGNETL